MALRLSQHPRKIAAGGAAVLTLSFAGASFVGAREGIITHAYPDPATKAQPWTICAGHTGRVVIKGKDYGPVRSGMVLSLEQCRVLLQQDSEKARAALNSCVDLPAGALTQNQSDALISFTINVGGTTACRSSVVRYVNNREWGRAADALLLYKFAAGRPMLLGRRQLERALFLKPEAPLIQRGTLSNLQHLNAELLK